MDSSLQSEENNSAQIAPSTRTRLQTLRTLIRDGAPLPAVLEEIASIALTVPGVKTATILQNEYLSDSNSPLYVVSQVSESGDSATNHTGQKTIDLLYRGRSLGKLHLSLEHELDPTANAIIDELSYQGGIALSTENTSRQLNSYESRLEVLNELNQLISSDLGFKRTTKTLARTVAFRFAADCAAILILTGEGSELEIKGDFGLHGEIPERFALRGSIFEKLLRFGGIMSLSDLKTNDQGLPFLVKEGITCVHGLTIEAGGRVHGIILVGYRNLQLLNEHDNAMLEEFSRGAAVALARAESRAKLKNYTEELETLVQSRTADLEIQTRRAEEANRAKSQFVANMSHELRTPLTAIVAYSNVMSDGIFGPVNDQQRDALDSIFRSAGHLKELIDDVLDVSKVEAGKTEPEPKSILLSETLTYVFKLMHQTAVGKQVKLLPYKPAEGEEDIHVFVDPRQIRQALLNLYSNAIKYTPVGGEVSVRVALGSDKVKISIIDTGVGIPAHDLERLFERYERGQDAFSKEQKGTGIGLSLTKHLVELNKGKIGVESSFGKGSEFWILIPRADQHPIVEDAIDLRAKRRALDTRLDGLNILVLDDNESTCEVLDIILTQVGASVYVAQTVAAAKKIFAETQIDAALVDLAIPEESGVSFIEYVRHQSDPMRQHIPLVVVSACVFKTDMEEAERAGASIFIAKPFQPQDLIQTVRTLTTEALLSS